MQIPAAGSPAAPPMSPSDAWLYAMQPLNNARSAPDDLSDADRWALSIGVARAKQQCELRSKDPFEGEDLLAMGKLCIFGQDYEPARQFLVSYIGLPQPKSPEVGRLLLIRSFIGLGSIVTAANQTESVVSLYPYDASIDLAIDMVIDAAAGSDATSDLEGMPRLEALQLPHILDALTTYKGPMTSNGDTVDAVLLVRDALRSADQLRRNGKPDDAVKIFEQVKAAAAAPSIATSASDPAIENALTRYQLYHQASPIRTLHATVLTASGPLAKRTIPLYDTNPAARRIVKRSGRDMTIRILDDRTLVLVFSLAGPASASAIRDMLARLQHDQLKPGNIVAVTSYAANTGDDAANPTVLAALRAFRAGLPPDLPVLLVPDSELKPFAIDAWPAAIFFDGKARILWMDILSGSTGSIHQAVREMQSGGPIFPL